jgi:hypothetical protein
MPVHLAVPPEEASGEFTFITLLGFHTLKLAHNLNSLVRVSRRDDRFHLCQSQCRVQASGREVFEAPRALAKNTPSNVIPFGTLIPTEDRYPRVESPAN